MNTPSNQNAIVATIKIPYNQKIYSSTVNISSVTSDINNIILELRTTKMMRYISIK